MDTQGSHTTPTQPSAKCKLWHTTTGGQMAKPIKHACAPLFHQKKIKKKLEINQQVVTNNLCLAKRVGPHTRPPHVGQEEMLELFLVCANADVKVVCLFEG